MHAGDPISRMETQTEGTSHPPLTEATSYELKISKIEVP